MKNWDLVDLSLEGMEWLEDKLGKRYIEVMKEKRWLEKELEEIAKEKARRL